MKKKLVSIAMALVLAASVLAGCGSQQGSGTSAAGAAAQESSAAVSAPEAASTAETAAAAPEAAQAASTEQTAASTAVTAADAADIGSPVYDEPVICIGSALYMTADLGVSTYDSVAITMADKWKWGKFQYIRIATDIVCVVLGTAVFLIGGGSWSRVPEFVGVGTIITAFFMGPLIEFFNVRIARPLLKDRQGEA